MLIPTNANVAVNNQYPESVYMAVASTIQVATGMTGELGT